MMLAKRIFVRRFSMTHAFCPECDAKITVGRDPSEGQQVSCPQCGAYLMVVGVSPLELDWAFDDEELEYDDDYDYEREDEY
jgi:lysine biosynthesis protein LysW